MKAISSGVIFAVDCLNIEQSSDKEHAAESGVIEQWSKMWQALIKTQCILLCFGRHWANTDKVRPANTKAGWMHSRTPILLLKVLIKYSSEGFLGI